jgi:hypothetical protein
MKVMRLLWTREECIREGRAFVAAAFFFLLLLKRIEILGRNFDSLRL